MCILQVEGIKKHFVATEVLNGIDFSLQKGQVLSVIGSSGSGKTTLLRCLTFLERPDEGRITVNGETIFDANDPATQREQDIRSKRLRFGLVFQSFNLFPQYTALQNVMLAQELRLPREKRRKAEKQGIMTRSMELLSQVGLADKADSYPHQLSGGQQQRVAIARALALNPMIMLFDEPTSALDPEISGEVLNTIRSLAERDMTMIIVTHEIGFAREVSDRVIYMADGCIEEDGPANEVLVDPKSPRLRSFLASVL